MEIRLNGKVALVTGGAIGIGRAIALELARSGATVAINYLNNPDDAAETLRQIREVGGEAIAVQGDATSVDEIERFVGEVEAKLGDIAILVNNVGGLGGRVRIEEITEEFYEKVMDVNVKTAFFVTKAVIPSLKRSGWGRVINLSSLAAHNGGGNGSVTYAAAKAALLGFTRGLAKELAPAVTVNAVAPGLIGGTPFHNTFTPVGTFEAIKKGIPAGREGFPVDVATTICFLCSEQASFITGECVEINGGAWYR